MTTANPLFVATTARLQQELRLSGLKSGADSEAILDKCMRTVRLGFIRQLGTARVQAIQAMAYVADALTDDQVTRGVANVTEVDWVRYELMGVMPTLFQDSAAGARDNWNRDAPFRHAGTSELQRMREELWGTIQGNLGLLEGTEVAADRGTVQGGVMEADDAPPVPFGSLWPNGVGSSVRTSVFPAGG